MAKKRTLSDGAASGEPATRLLGAIDVGSNSIRLAVVEASADGSWRTLETLQQPVRLGVDTFTSGAISPDSMRATCEVIAQFKSVLATYHVDTLRAVATSAVREASNRDTFIDRVAQQTGVAVETIEAVVESGLTFSYLRRFLGERRHSLAGRGLVIDIGAGSVEIMLVEKGHLVFSESQRTGTLRLLQLMGGASERRAMQILGPIVQQSIDIFSRVHPVAKTSKLYVNSPLLARVLAECPGVTWTDGVAGLSAGTLRRLASEVFRLDISARMGRFDVRASEAEELVPSLLVAERFARMARSATVLVFGVSMMDCLIYDMTGGGRRDEAAEFDRQVRAGAEFIGQKYHFDREHHEQVTRLALVLFDALAPLHALGARSRLLLETAAMLHDIGIYVSTRAHHKHSAYLVAASEITGLSEDDVRVVANVVRYHRKAMPKPSHLDYTILGRDDRLTVSKLASILRIADALDCSHRRRIRSLRVEPTPSELVLWADSSEELSIEQWALPHKADFFKSLYGLEVVLRRDK